MPCKSKFALRPRKLYVQLYLADVSDMSNSKALLHSNGESVSWVHGCVEYHLNNGVTSDGKDASILFSELYKFRPNTR